MNPDQDNDQKPVSLDGVFPHDQHHHEHHHEPPRVESVVAPDPTGHHTLPVGDEMPTMEAGDSSGNQASFPPEPLQPVAPFTPEVSSVSQPQHHATALFKAPKVRLRLGKTRHYLVEYILSFWTLGITIGGLITLMDAIVDYYIKPANSSGAYAYLTSALHYPLTVAAITAILVALPLYIVFSSRTRNYELQNPGVWKHHWQQIVYNLALVELALAAIGYSTAMLYSFVNAVMGAGLTTASSAVSWGSVLKQVFAIMLFVVTFLFYSKQKPREEE